MDAAHLQPQETALVRRANHQPLPLATHPTVRGSTGGKTLWYVKVGTLRGKLFLAAIQGYTVCSTLTSIVFWFAKSLTEQILWYDLKKKLNKVTYRCEHDARKIITSVTWLKWDLCHKC
jgi:hypothetical protein